MASNIVQEQRGLAKVHAVCAEMEAIWRPTTTTDIGIDGQLEFLELGSHISTGTLLAVQVKSGPSYFIKRTEHDIEFHPADKHRRYWSRLAIPVLLVLHNPDDNLTIYARVKPQLVSGGSIRVPLSNHFDAGARESLLGGAREDLVLVPPGEVLSDLKSVTYVLDGGHEINGIHFLLASIHPKLSFFELRMCRLLALIELASGSSGISINSETYEFLLRCVMKIWTHGLTEPFVRDFEKSWYEFKMVPDISVPITPWGLTVLEHLWTNVDNFLDGDEFGLGFQGAIQLARMISTLAQLESDRLDASDRLGDVPR